MILPNLLTEWARLLVQSLADAGITRAVVSPGSRSTPFAWAALECSGLDTRIMVDERSAGFYALGQAKLSGRASLLICTSGTAAANYFPCVVEAAHSHTPLLVLTADRPFELADRAALQTIDQIKLYGGYVRRFVELGLPDDDVDALRSLRHTAFAAEHATRIPVSGPVHVNARARKPLEPMDATTSRAARLSAEVDRLLKEQLSVSADPRCCPAPGDLQSIARDCSEAASGLIVCGPARAAEAPSAEAVAALADRTGFVVLSETTSQLRLARPASLSKYCCDAVEPLFSSLAVAPRPHVVLQVGPPPTCRSYAGYLARQPDVGLYVLARGGWLDPTSRARGVLAGDPHLSVLGLGTALQSAGHTGFEPRREGRIAFRKWLLGADREVWRAVDELLDAESSVFSEGQAVRTTLEALPAGSVLVVGNSLPVREVDLVSPGRDAGITVVSQRGASGIDGLVSGAVGSADAAGRPTTLLVGDVSLLHDLTGLWAGRTLQAPLVVVVLNNGGGKIFEMLPVGCHPSIVSKALEAWTTPPGLSISRIAALFEVSFSRVICRPTLCEALGQAHRRPGLSLVEVVIDPATVAEQHSKLLRASRQAIERFGSPPIVGSV